MTDVNQIVTAIENKKPQRHHDWISIQIWLDELKEEGANGFYKAKLDPPPSGLRLAEDVFIFVILTQFQSDAFQHLGSTILGIDATHNVTGYTRLMLVTIMARDLWGHSKQMNYFAIYGGAKL
jgi:hypothetical protein